MRFDETEIPGLFEIRPKRIGDDRGYFSEVFRQSLFDAAIGPEAFVQENESLSMRAGTVRGLHFQSAPFAQGKLVRCLTGAIFDVAVDLRHGSPDFGRWVGVTLSADEGNQLWIPEGFAHGFCTLMPETRVCYKVTAPYSPEHDKGVAWDDPDIGIEWPGVADAQTLSGKDRAQPKLADLAHHFTMES